MQLDDKTILCESENGIVSVFNNTVAYELKYKQIVIILNSEQVHSLKNELQNLKDSDWFSTAALKLTFFNFPQLNGNYLISESEVAEMLQLLLEATAMIKVHHKLFLKTGDRIN